MENNENIPAEKFDKLTNEITKIRKILQRKSVIQNKKADILIMAIAIFTALIAIYICILIIYNFKFNWFFIISLLFPSILFLSGLTILYKMYKINTLLHEKESDFNHKKEWEKIQNKRYEERLMEINEEKLNNIVNNLINNKCSDYKNKLDKLNSDLALYDKVKKIYEQLKKENSENK